MTFLETFFLGKEYDLNIKNTLLSVLEYNASFPLRNIFYTTTLMGTEGHLAYSPVTVFLKPDIAASILMKS